MGNQRIRRAVRILGSALLLVLIIWKVDIDQALLALRGTDLGLFSLAASLHLIGIGIRAVRWHGLLAARGCRVPRGTLVHIILVGMFANNFLPTSFGGDAYRGIAVEKKCAGLSRSLASVVVDRFLGLAALLLLAAIALATGVLDDIGGDHYLWVVIGSGVGGALLLGAFLVTGGWRSFVGRIPFPAVRGRVQRFTEAVQAYWSVRNALASAFAWSVAMQVLIIYQFYLFSLSLGLTVPFMVFALFVPIILTLLMLPVSIGGLGVREGLFIVFLGTAGVPGSDALAISLLYFGTAVALSMYGGYILMVSSNDERRWLIPRSSKQDPR